MQFWIRECPKCGYVAQSISDKSAVTKKWLKSESYICSGHDDTDFYIDVLDESGNSIWHTFDTSESMRAYLEYKTGCPIIMDLIEGI